MTIQLIGTAATLVTISLIFYQYIIYPAFLSPLAKIPSAHWTCSFSPLWILYQRWQRRNNNVTYAAHRALGSIVRLGPKELSINCVDGGIRTIYTGGFEKDLWYPNQFANFGVRNMFSTLEHHPHAIKKRIMANIYSKSFLQTSAQVKANSIALFQDRFFPVIESFAESGEEVDVHDLNNAFTMDFMSAFQFGLASSTNFSQDIQLRKKMLHYYHSRRVYEFYTAETPTLKHWSSFLGPLRLVPAWVSTSSQWLEQFGRTMALKADNYISDVENPGDEPVVYKYFRNGFGKLLEKELGGRSATPVEQDHYDRTVYSEMLDHLSAGHETSALALTYLYLEMSRRPELQAKLRAEIQTLEPQILWPPKDPGDFALPEPKQIDSLSLLHAILMETLRLHAPIPGMEPRITPDTPCTLVGYKNIPPRTRVSAMSYCLHRNPEVFPEPEIWRPERWLIEQASPEYKEMLRWFWAFGSGGRMCIGSNLAVQEIKLIVCAVYGNYRTKIAEGGDVNVEEIDAYTTRPASGGLGLHFLKA